MPTNHLAISALGVSLLISACELNTFGLTEGPAATTTSSGLTTQEMPTSSTTVLTAGSLTTHEAPTGSTPVTETAGLTTPETPTTTGTTTDNTDATTDAPPSTTTTTDATATTTTDNCELAPECQAGTVETGAQCESCGVQRRTCRPDCTWSAQTCEQDLNTCAYWRLPAGAKVWQRHPVDPQAAHAPKETVLAAIDIITHKQIYVLTATKYHILSTVNQTWTATGSRDTLFPKIKGLPLRFGTSLDGGWYVVSFHAGTRIYDYLFHSDTKIFEQGGDNPCCDDKWVPPNAPDPWSLRAGWAQRDDLEGWMLGDAKVLCAPDPADKPYTYRVAIGAGFVYVQDGGPCYKFYAPVPYAKFPPFTHPGAPAHDLIGAAASLDGLWIFRGQ